MVDEETKPIEWIAVVDKDGNVVGAVSKDWYKFAYKTFDKAYKEISRQIFKDLFKL